VHREVDEPSLWSTAASRHRRIAGSPAARRLSISGSATGRIRMSKAPRISAETFSANQCAFRLTAFVRRRDSTRRLRRDLSPRATSSRCRTSSQLDAKKSMTWPSLRSQRS
jgi:hypothetical protein